MDDERVKRLSERFTTIRTTIAELTDADTAFAVATVAYLEAIEYTCLQALRRVEKDCLGRNPPEFDSIVPEMHEAIRGALKGHHKQICEHLGLNQLDIIQRSASFKEIVDDICKQRG